jgi:hypothetical protein
MFLNIGGLPVTGVLEGSEPVDGVDDGIFFKYLEESSR